MAAADLAGDGIYPALPPTRAPARFSACALLWLAQRGGHCKVATHPGPFGLAGATAEGAASIAPASTMPQLRTNIVLDRSLGPRSSMNCAGPQRPPTMAAFHFLNASRGPDFGAAYAHHPPNTVIRRQLRGSTDTKTAPAGLETPNYILQPRQRFLARGNDRMPARHKVESKSQT